MDSKKLNLWLKALRSGDYVQTNNALQRINADEEGPAGYCCLGVLTDVAIKNGCEIAAAPYEDTGLMGYDGEIAYPPPSVARWAGELPINDLELATMNDGGGITFAEIADRLEAAHGA